MNQLDLTFADLEAELDLWADASRRATFWWRDDDAVAPSPALDRMLIIAARHSVPLGLAVIPAKAEPALADRLGSARAVFVLQHGFLHKNHAGDGAGYKAEFGGQRTLAEEAADLAQGWGRLAEFERRTPIFVPPWNRYHDGLAPALAQLGHRAVSGFGVRGTRQLNGHVIELNCHCDIISWRTTRGFCGEGKALDKLLRHLQDRRTFKIDPDEPTGLLTHHLDHDQGCWRFVDKLFRVTVSHRATKWINPAEAIAETATGERRRA